jgi:transcriptional regulator with XRE-family HTH domain
MTALHPPPAPYVSDTVPAVSPDRPREHSAARRRDALGPEVWRHPAMRAALAARDIGAVFRLVQRFGVSQRRIAALTGQSEISEILSGRQVLSYEVLARVADGFGIPRGWMGLSYDDSTLAILEQDADDPAGWADGEAGEPEQTRALLARAAKVTVGAAPGDEMWRRCRC